MYVPPENMGWMPYVRCVGGRQEALRGVCGEARQGRKGAGVGCGMVYVPPENMGWRPYVRCVGG